ncbi:MAG TPA: DUF1178 family protein [Alphaproteobacteria bacterium]|jgi:hypothetical protein
MISFNLSCKRGHVFQAWFKDSKTYDRQRARREVACPECGNTTIEKAPMAPRLLKSRGDKAERAAARKAALINQLRELRRHVEATCDNVGDKFAEEARKIHYGETDPRGIYGDATPEEARELAEEGIPFGAIPWIDRHDS